MKAKINALQRKEIIELCKQGVKQEDIAKEYGLSAARVSQIMRENGIRRVLMEEGEKKCPHCKANNPQMAKFCMFCGADVRDERKILIEKVGSLRAMLSLLPDSAQGEADEITRMVLKYLGGR